MPIPPPPTSTRLVSHQALEAGFRDFLLFGGHRQAVFKKVGGGLHPGRKVCVSEGPLDATQAAVRWLTAQGCLPTSLPPPPLAPSTPY